MPRELILLKLGGSLITHKDKPSTPDMHTIERLAKEIHEAKHERDFGLILGHGGGSFPHFPAKKYETHKGMIHKHSPRGFAETQDAAARLNRLVVTALLNAGENAVSVSPSSCSISKHGAVSHFFYLQIQLMLKHNLLPVLYGDPVMDTHRGCSILSTETILGHLAKKLKAGRIIMATRVDMVYDNDPRTQKGAKPIGEINARNYARVLPLLSGSGTRADVTGGMKHKVGELMALAKTGVEAEIAGGMIPGNIGRALIGKKHVRTLVCG